MSEDQADNEPDFEPESVLEEHGDLELDKQDGSDFRSPYDPKEIRVDPRVYSIRQVLDMVQDAELDLAPDFQRLKVWKLSQKSSLIESLLLRIPLPAFYFSSNEDGLLQVVDGVQRLSTVTDYVNDKFKLSRLEYLQDAVGKKLFSEINNTIWSRRIMNTQITAFVIDPQTPAPVKFDIFRRINTGGSPLNSQEIRHCMSRNRSREFLKELATTPSFNDVTNYKYKDNVRMADRELALRFVAFRRLEDVESYTYSSIDDLLTVTTSALDDPSQISDADLDHLRTAFDTAMKNAKTIFGLHAFRKWYSNDDYMFPMNRSLFDVWSVELAKYSPDDVCRISELVRDAARDLMTNDSQFLDAVSVSTGNREKVLRRFRDVQQLMVKAIDC